MTDRKSGYVAAHFFAKFGSQAYHMFGVKTQKELHERLAVHFGTSANTFKNWRDSFDQHYPHRKGWHQRPLTGTMKEVFDQTHGLSFEEFVRRVRQGLPPSLVSVQSVVDGTASQEAGIHPFIAHFRSIFAGFRTFAECGEAYRDREDSYKREAAAAVQELLGAWVRGAEGTLGPEAFADAVRSVLSASNLTSADWRGRDAIVQKLLESPAHIRGSRQRLHRLLHVAGTKADIGDALDALVAWLLARGCSQGQTKTFPTIFLFYLFPDRFVYLKPRFFDRFLRAIGEPPLGEGRPLTSAEYARALETMQRVRAAAAELEPRDMIDMHSFYFVIGGGYGGGAARNDGEEPGQGGHPPEPRGGFGGELPRLLATFADAMRDLDFRLTSSLPACLLGALLVRRFALLTGLSGSGKTKLAQLFAAWGCENPSQYVLVAVGANWTSKDDLLGYADALDATRYVARPALRLLLGAVGDPDHPYFLILDEMNLSHVERYFSDFRSAMESDEPIVLHEGGERKMADGTVVPAQIDRMPKNMFVVGTVNVDETTYMFSPKVLDRANVIEFRADKKAITDFLTGGQDIDLDAIAGRGAGFAEAFVLAANAPTSLGEPYAPWLRDEVTVVFEVLSDYEAEFGFRTARAVTRFVQFYVMLSGDPAEKKKRTALFTAAMDAQIMQKILPKMHGSKKKLGPVLRALGELCYGREGTDEARLERARKAAKNAPAEGSPFKNKKLDELAAECRDNVKRSQMRYPVSFEKIVRMLRKLDRDGFASFAEA